MHLVQAAQEAGYGMGLRQVRLGVKMTGTLQDGTMLCTCRRECGWQVGSQPLRPMGGQRMHVKTRPLNRNNSIVLCTWHGQCTQLNDELSAWKNAWAGHAQVGVLG